VKCAVEDSRLRKGWRRIECHCGERPLSLVWSPSGFFLLIPRTKESTLRNLREQDPADEHGPMLAEVAKRDTLSVFQWWRANTATDEMDYAVLCSLALAVDDHGVTWTDLGVTAARSS